MKAKPAGGVEGASGGFGVVVDVTETSSGLYGFSGVHMIPVQVGEREAVPWGTEAACSVDAGTAQPAIHIPIKKMPALLGDRRRERGIAELYTRTLC